tara:strand:+ start:538 stop:2040 length:1503 start_codon:yes stop_codon:yes gene_type:complete
MKLFEKITETSTFSKESIKKLLELNKAPKTNFVFITSGNNNSKWIEKCLNSISSQNYSKEMFRIIYVDDASTDNSKEVCEKWISENPDINITFKSNPKNLGPAGSRYFATQEAKDDEVCIFLDGDDWFKNNDALLILNAIYDNFEDVASTYGGSQMYAAPKKIYYRNKEFNGDSGNFFPHLRTCKAIYAKAVPEEYLKYKGEWIKVATDIALFQSIEELADNRHVFIHSSLTLMHYNRENEMNNTETGWAAAKQNKKATQIRKEYSKNIAQLEPLKPLHSNSNPRLGVIVPYRDREEHLKEFAPHIKKYLSDQGIPNILIIVEQADNQSFNRAKLMNIGYDLLKDKCDYFCFHDIDLLPEKDVDYSYSKYPTHLSAYCSQFDYKLPYETLFGGVTMFNKEDFIKVNGFSNMMWGWGGEDDEIRLRCDKEGLAVDRRPGRYTSLPHPFTKTTSREYHENVKQLKDLKEGKISHKQNGINSLEYKVVSVENDKGYLLVKVKI